MVGCIACSTEGSAAAKWRFPLLPLNIELQGECGGEEGVVHACMHAYLWVRSQRLLRPSSCYTSLMSRGEADEIDRGDELVFTQSNAFSAAP